MLIKQYMTKDPVCVSPSDEVSEVFELFGQTNHDGFPVLENNRLVGIVTLRDLVKTKRSKRKKEKVSEIMTVNVITASPDDDLVSVAGVMAFHRIHHMPIMDKAEDRLVGIISSSDMLRACVENIVSENIRKIFDSLRKLRGNISLNQGRVEVESLIPTQEFLDKKELELRREQFSRGVVYPVVVAKKGSRHYIIDGHHRAYLAKKGGMKEVHAFIVEGELEIFKTAEKLKIKNLEELTILSER